MPSDRPAYGWPLRFALSAFRRHGEDAGLRIEVEGAQPVMLSFADLRKLKRLAIEDRRTVTRNGGSRESAVKYGGVALADLLESVGLTKLDPHVQRRAAIFALAGDGYQAAFSWVSCSTAPPACACWWSTKRTASRWTQATAR